MEIRHSRLANGLQVVTARLPGFLSATVAAAVDAGARHETRANNGVAHFLEHMAFKGTESRSAAQIGAEVEQIGSSINAFTSQAMTAYYVNGLGSNVRTSVAILGDVLTHSLLEQEHIDRERGVILQEIKRNDDSPQSVAGQCFARTAYPDQPAGFSILGDVNFVRAAQRENFAAFLDTHYRTRNMVVVGAGDLDHDAFCDDVAEQFAALPVGDGTTPQAAKWVGGYDAVTNSRFEQVNVFLGLPSVPISDPAYMAHRTMVIALGNGFSSPLFQEVREKRGLVYSTSAFSDHQGDHGDIAIFGGMTTENLPTFLDVVCDLLARADTVITEVDLERARSAMLVSLATEKERPLSLAIRQARQLFLTGKPADPELEQRQIEAVSLFDVREAARSLRGVRPTLAMAGPLDSGRDYYGQVTGALGYVG
jgi:predicted Zn-dependent peptidase